MRTHVGHVLLRLGVLALPQTLRSESRPVASEVITINAGNRTLYRVSEHCRP